MESYNGYQSFFSIIRATQLRKNINQIKKLMTDCMKINNPNSIVEIRISDSGDFYFIYKDLSEDKRDKLLNDKMVLSLHSGNLINQIRTVDSRSHLHEGNRISDASNKQKIDLLIDFSIKPNLNNSGQIIIKKLIPIKNIKPIHLNFIRCLQQTFNNLPILFTRIEGDGKPTPHGRKGREAIPLSTPFASSSNTIDDVIDYDIKPTKLDFNNDGTIQQPIDGTIQQQAEEQQRKQAEEQQRKQAEEQQRKQAEEQQRKQAEEQQRKQTNGITEQQTNETIKQNEEFILVTSKKNKKKNKKLNGGYKLKYMKYKIKYLKLKKELETKNK